MTEEVVKSFNTDPELPFAPPWPLLLEGEGARRTESVFNGEYAIGFGEGGRADVVLRPLNLAGQRLFSFSSFQPHRPWVRGYTEIELLVSHFRPQRRWLVKIFVKRYTFSMPPPFVQPAALSPAALGSEANLLDGMHGSSHLHQVLPPSETFDVLPNLHELLSRLLAEVQDSSRPPTYPNQEILHIQQLSAQVSSIRNEIRKARERIRSLPDVERSTADQNLEMIKLQEIIERQRSTLHGLESQTI